MNLQFKKLGKGVRSVLLDGKAIGTLEFSSGKWVMRSWKHPKRPEYLRYFKTPKLAKQFCKADPKFYLGIGA